MEPSEPIVCTLTPAGVVSQLSEWEALQRLASDAHAVPGGARLTFPLAARDDVEDLARRERRCCSFLDITTEVDGPLLIVTVTSSRRDAQGVIAALTGVG